MTDPVREAVGELFHVDELVTAWELPGQRLRFRLAEGDDAHTAVDVALGRALDLVACMPEPMLVRVVSWGAPRPPMREWFPDLAHVVHEGATEDGAIEHVRTVEVSRAHPGVGAALRAALSGEVEIGVWLFAEQVLLRPYDDRGADVVGTSAASLARFRDECADFLMEDRLDRMVRCELAFVCDVSWTDMEATADPSVRSCAKCAREVYDVRDEAEFLDHARAGRCVAVPLGLVSVRTFADTALPGPRPPAPPEPFPGADGDDDRLAGAPVYPPDFGRGGPVDELDDRPFWRRLFGRRRAR